MRAQVRSKQITANLFPLFSLSKGRNLYLHHTIWVQGLPAGQRRFLKPGYVRTARTAAIVRKVVRIFIGKLNSETFDLIARLILLIAFVILKFDKKKYSS